MFSCCLFLQTRTTAPPWLTIILCSQPGGQDAQLLTENKSTFVDTRYLLATGDAEPAHIMVRTEGWRTGPPEVLTRLLDPVEGDKVSPDEYRFRIFIRLETGDERYRWVNEGMWIGSGVRRGLEGESSLMLKVPGCLAGDCWWSKDLRRPVTDIAYSDLRRISASLNASGFRDWSEIYLCGAFD